MTILNISSYPVHIRPLVKAISILGGISKFSAKLGFSRQFVYMLLKGKSKISIEKCLMIEELTLGIVGRKDLRPDVFDEKIKPSDRLDFSQKIEVCMTILRDLSDADKRGKK